MMSPKSSTFAVSPIFKDQRPNSETKFRFKIVEPNGTMSYSEGMPSFHDAVTLRKVKVAQWRSIGRTPFEVNQKEDWNAFEAFLREIHAINYTSGGIGLTQNKRT